jgi:hypothetical protein
MVTAQCSPYDVAAIAAALIQEAPMPPGRVRACYAKPLPCPDWTAKERSFLDVCWVR